MRKVYRSTAYRPRSLRHSESKAKKRLIYTIVGILVATYVFFNWGLPFIIGHLSFLNKRGKPVDAETLKIDEAIAPPVLYIPYEATNSASLPISGYAAPLSRVEVYIDDEIKSQTSTDSEGKFTTSPIALNLGTNNISAVTINDSDKKSLPSKNIKLYFSSEKPSLEISEPSDGAEIKGDKKVKVAGKTDENNSVTVNGSTVVVDAAGNFQTIVPLNDGDNTITIISSNSFGNSNQMQRTVKFVSQDPAPSSSPSP
jgi:hypothetical protein